MLPQATIAALATPSGRGGIGIIRISGCQVTTIAPILLGKLPKPRYAMVADFTDKSGELIDQGIALYFPAPHSFTGEDVLELQGHGGMVVMDSLLQAIIELGVELARPGEFSERAFLNGKIDLVQAEAIADLIDSASVQASRSALRSLQGQFSKQIHYLVEQLIWLRTYVEADIDFTDEEIDLLADGKIITKITDLIQYLQTILQTAQQGFLLKEGVQIALIGEPNVGKSSLLNCLAGRDTAIVTPIPGTTRDTVRDQIQLEGIPLHIIDTAGLRETNDLIEQAGIERTKIAIKAADLIILILDVRYPNQQAHQQLLNDLKKPLIIIYNKIDLISLLAKQQDDRVYLSAKTGEGIQLLKQVLKKKLAVHEITESIFIARRRHLTALQQAKQALEIALIQANNRQTELLAEELLQAQQFLNQITGEFTSNDLLGEIFSSFCIGK
ncbi:MAG: tRNA uridine-5-carboxymethylaminomethyl(34) synthesis GTPase MnmE [Thiomargarita sp.]|nr:tRNA uridine-5-carboxymethylaminomethyl(34) synthesis GTPase MnmE [Thiomargarita sp.]